MSQIERLAVLMHETLWAGSSTPSDGCTNCRVDADLLVRSGVRIVPDPDRFDQDERDAEAEAHFLKPINPDPVTTFAKTNKVKR